MTLHRPYTGLRDDVVIALSPQDAGWEWTGLTVLALTGGRERVVRTGEHEVFVLPLKGGLTVEVGDSEGRAEESFELTGRESVFSRVTDFLYAGRDSTLVLRSESDVEVALPMARCSTRRPAAYGPAEDVPVEVRGSGTATRQVNNFGIPGVWDHAEKLICCELITPPGNWSSYPPHKHDASEPCPVVNEEIYYYRIAGPDQVTPSRDGVGYHRTYTGPEHQRARLAPLDELIEVRDHDTVLVPHGYHGPCMAAPGYPMYYLNVMAGPADERALVFCDDPDHNWVRDTWEDEDTDPRCPVTSVAGRLDSLAPRSPGRHT